MTHPTPIPRTPVMENKELPYNPVTGTGLTWKSCLLVGSFCLMSLHGMRPLLQWVGCFRDQSLLALVAQEQCGIGSWGQ